MSLLFVGWMDWRQRERGPASAGDGPSSGISRERSTLVRGAMLYRSWPLRPTRRRSRFASPITWFIVLSAKTTSAEAYCGATNAGGTGALTAEAALPPTMLPFTSTAGSPLFTIGLIAPGKPSEVPTTVVVPVPLPVPVPVPVPVPAPLPVLPLPPDVVVPGVVLTVAAGCGVVAARSWLAEVLALERVPWTASFVAAARW